MSMEYGILMYLDTKLRKEIEILAKMSFMVILAVPYVQKVNFLPQTFLSVFWKLIGLQLLLVVYYAQKNLDPWKIYLERILAILLVISYHPSKLPYISKWSWKYKEKLR